MTDEERKIILEELYNVSDDQLIVISGRYCSDIEDFKRGGESFDSLSLYDLFNDDKTSKKMLINNEYGLFGSLFYKYKDSFDLDLLKIFIERDINTIVQIENEEYDFYHSVYCNCPLFGEVLKDKDFILKVLDFLSLRYYDSIDGEEIWKKIPGPSDRCMQLINDSLRKDKDFMVSLVKKSYLLFNFVDDSLKNDRDFIMSVCPYVIKYFPTSLKKDKEIVLLALDSNEYNYEYIDSSLYYDYDVLQLLAKKIFGDAFNYDFKILYNKKFLSKFINPLKNNSSPSKSRKRNKERAVISALKLDYNFFEFLNDEYKNNVEFMVKLLDENIKLSVDYSMYEAIVSKYGDKYKDYLFNNDGPDDWFKDWLV